MAWSSIKTSCRDCIFAKFEDKTQKGCEHNRIYKFARIGVNVVPVYDENNIEFFVINGRACQYYRRIDWKNANDGQDLVEVIKKEIQLNYTLFVSLYEKNIEEIISCVNSFDIPPTKLAIINRQDVAHTKTLIKKYSGYWEEINVLEEHPNYWFAHSNIMANKVRSLLYLIQDENEINKTNDLINKINKLINENLCQIECIVKEDNIVGGLVLLHRYYGQNYINEIKDKNNILNV